MMVVCVMNGGSSILTCFDVSRKKGAACFSVCSIPTYKTAQSHVPNPSKIKFHFKTSVEWTFGDKTHSKGKVLPRTDHEGQEGE